MCKDLQDSLRIYNFLQGSAIFCKDLQYYARVSQDCNILQRYARSCKDLQGSAMTARFCKDLQGLQGSARFFDDLQHSARICNTQQGSAILKNNLQIARFSKNLQYSTRYLIAQELKVLDVFTLTSSESFISLQSWTTDTQWLNP